MSRWSFFHPALELAAGLILMGLGGCAHYQAKPLPDQPDLAESLPPVNWARVAA